MLLQDYLLSSESGAARLMGALGVSRAYLYQMATGRRPITPKRAVLIESVTEGKVSRKDLFPGDWQDTWPEMVANSKQKPAQTLDDQALGAMDVQSA